MRQEQGKKRLIDLAKIQDGPYALTQLEGVRRPALLQLATSDAAQADAPAAAPQSSTNALAQVQAIVDNPTAFPHIAAVSPHCRALALSLWYEDFINVVIVVNIFV
jgi:hypothetical protein